MEFSYPRPAAQRRNLLDLPLIGRFLKWRHARPVMQATLLLAALLLLFDGFLGPQEAYRNVATVTAWIHYRGFLMLALLVAGNLFCMACPFMLPRKFAKQLQARWNLGRGWPGSLPQLRGVQPLGQPMADGVGYHGLFRRGLPDGPVLQRGSLLQARLPCRAV
jgi:hypothetical protein